MGTEIVDIVDGCADMLKSVSGLRSVTSWPADVPMLPGARVQLGGTNNEFALGGSSFQGTVIVTVYGGPGLATESVRQLYDFISPTGPQSIEAASDADKTWGGAVCFAELVSVAAPRMVDIYGTDNSVPAIDLTFRVVQKVLT